MIQKLFSLSGRFFLVVILYGIQVRCVCEWFGSYTPWNREMENAKQLWWWWGCIVYNAVPSSFYDYKSRCLWGGIINESGERRRETSNPLPPHRNIINLKCYCCEAIANLAENKKWNSYRDGVQLNLSTIQFFVLLASFVFLCPSISIISLVCAVQNTEMNKQTQQRIAGIALPLFCVFISRVSTKCNVCLYIRFWFAPCPPNKSLLIIVLFCCCVAVAVCYWLLLSVCL